MKVLSLNKRYPGLINYVDLLLKNKEQGQKGFSYAKIAQQVMMKYGYRFCISKESVRKYHLWKQGKLRKIEREQLQYYICSKPYNKR